MNAMKKYSGLLEMGIRLEDAGMHDNARKLYKNYVEALDKLEYDGILDRVYGSGTFKKLSIENYTDAIEKGSLVMRLNTLHKLAKKYLKKWNDNTIDPRSEINSNSKILVEFLHWLSKVKHPSNDDFIRINEMIRSLELRSRYHITIPNEDISLTDLIEGTMSGVYVINVKRYEVEYD